MEAGEEWALVGCEEGRSPRQEEAPERPADGPEHDGGELVAAAWAATTAAATAAATEAAARAGDAGEEAEVERDEQRQRLLAAAAATTPGERVGEAAGETAEEEKKEQVKEEEEEEEEEEDDNEEGEEQDQVDDEDDDEVDDEDQGEEDAVEAAKTCACMETCDACDTSSDSSCEEDDGSAVLSVSEVSLLVRATDSTAQDALCSALHAQLLRQGWDPVGSRLYKVTPCARTSLLLDLGDGSGNAGKGQAMIVLVLGAVGGVAEALARLGSELTRGAAVLAVRVVDDGEAAPEQEDLDATCADLLSATDESVTVLPPLWLRADGLGEECGALCNAIEAGAVFQAAAVVTAHARVAISPPPVCAARVSVSASLDAKPAGSDELKDGGSAGCECDRESGACACASPCTNECKCEDVNENETEYGNESQADTLEVALFSEVREKGWYDTDRLAIVVACVALALLSGSIFYGALAFVPAVQALALCKHRKLLRVTAFGLVALALAGSCAQLYGEQAVAPQQHQHQQVTRQGHIKHASDAAAVELAAVRAELSRVRAELTELTRGKAELDSERKRAKAELAAAQATAEERREEGAVLRGLLADALNRCGWWCNDLKADMGHAYGIWFSPGESPEDKPALLYLKLEGQQTHRI
jgi:hypothetical protein